MTVLRPLTTPALSLSAPKAVGRPPKLDFLPLSKLRIDDGYQRDVSPRGLRTIATIHNDFDWNRFAPLIVARVPGGDLHVIIDGQHRATAALLRGYELVPCAIVEASALEQAAIFSSVNGNVTPITILQLFKAARAAKAPWALDVDAACGIAGLTPLVYPKPKSHIKPFETMAIGTLRKNIARYGVQTVGAALKSVSQHPGAADPGFWNSSAITQAITEWRSQQGKRQEPAATSATSLTQRIRELRRKGHSRFAIQAALRCKLADIEEALRGAE